MRIVKHPCLFIMMNMTGFDEIRTFQLLFVLIKIEFHDIDVATNSYIPISKYNVCENSVSNHNNFF